MLNEIIQIDYKVRYDPTSENLKEDDTFREDLLNIFRMKKYNDEEIIGKINTLFTKVKSHSRYTTVLGQLFTKRANLIFSEDEQTGFMMMFNFHSMNKTMDLLYRMDNASDEEWEQMNLETFMND